MKRDVCMWFFLAPYRRTIPAAFVINREEEVIWQGHPMATELETAIADVIIESKVRTYDMGGSSSTLDIANAVADKL